MPVAIAGLTLLLFPFAAMFLTGDLSRYLPRSMFADKDQLALASASASVCVAAIRVRCIWGAAAAVFQRSRIGGRQR
jgi:hypothetical protein